MRDLQADLAICEAATPSPIRTTPCTCGRCKQVFISLTHSDGRLDPEDAQFIVEAREGWPHAIRRAKTAEDEVDRLEAKLDSLQDELRMLQDTINQRFTK